MTISPNVTQGLSRVVLQLQKHSPLLLTSAGVIGLIGAGVLAAKATLKLEETLDMGQDNLKWTKQSVANGDAPQQEVTKALVKNAIEIVKLYGVPVSLAVTSSVLILSGHNILSKRNAALVVAYKGLETAFNNYRGRVIEQYGAEVDSDFRLGLRNETIEDENGKKKKVQTLDRVSTSEYIFDFNPSNDNWVGNQEHNMFFLRGQQNILNDRLRAKGHLFLSEVLDNLGLDRTPASIVTGWIYDPKGEIGGEGDNYVEFNIKDLWDSQGYILLDFNVDGTIFDKI